MTTLEKATQIIEKAQIIILASIDQNGYPRPVPMCKLSQNENGEIYISTGTSSAKTAHFRANPKAGMSITEGTNSIVYTGIIEFIEDKELKHALWKDWMLAHFPNGAEDPEYCVLKFVPESATYWIDNVFMKDNEYLNLFCQSCGMPMHTHDLFGTNVDDTPNTDYCIYCYQNGLFVQDCTMEEMIEHCLKYLDEYNGASNTKYSKEEAIAEMRKHFPKLKRWVNK